MVNYFEMALKHWNKNVITGLFSKLGDKITAATNNIVLSTPKDSRLEINLRGGIGKHSVFVMLTSNSVSS